MPLFVHYELSIDFYSRASREARHGFETSFYPQEEISTHAPLARRDKTGSDIKCGRLGISTHAPLARRDGVFLAGWLIHGLFLLTRLSRGATRRWLMSRISITDFYSRASREARRGIFGRMVNPWLISTHAPLARRDSRQQHKE